MKACGVLFILLAVAQLATAQTGAAQLTPSYRPPPSSPQYRPPANATASPPAAPSSPTPPQSAPAAPAAQPASNPAAPPATTTSPAAPSYTASGSALSPATTAALTPLGESVSILDSPPVPDLGDNSVIWGLFHGSLTAIEPNVIVCARLPNAQNDQSCTAPCRRGHICYYQQFLQPFPAGSSVRVSVRNVDQHGVQSTLAYQVINPATCTMSSPCYLPVANEQVYGKGALVKLAFAPGCTAATSGATAQNTTAPGAAGSAAVATPGHPLTFSGPNDGPYQATLTFKPTAPSQTSMVFTGVAPQQGTQVIATGNNLVAVQTVMQGIQGNKKCSDYKPDQQACNGITIHANIPNARFVQFFYRQAIASNGQPKALVADNCQHFNSKNPQSCFDMTVDPESNPNWVPDAASPPSPYYSATDTIIGCTGSTMFDSPTFYDSLGADISEWVFHGRVFVISGGMAVGTVDWTLRHSANNSDPDEGDYTSINVQMLDSPLSQLPDPFATVLTKYQINQPIGDQTPQ